MEDQRALIFFFLYKALYNTIESICFNIGMVFAERLGFFFFFLTSPWHETGQECVYVTGIYVS